MRTEAGSGVSRLGAPLGATAGSAAITGQGDVRREEGTGQGDGLLPAAPLRTPPPPEGDERQCRLRAGPPTLSRHWPREVRPLSKETELGRLGRESLTQGRGETQSFEVALTVLLRPRGQTDRHLLRRPVPVPVRRPGPRRHCHPLPRSGPSPVGAAAPASPPPTCTPGRGPAPARPRGHADPASAPRLRLVLPPPYQGPSGCDTPVPPQCSPERPSEKQERRRQPAPSTRQRGAVQTQPGSSRLSTCGGTGVDPTQTTPDPTSSTGRRGRRARAHRPGGTRGPWGRARRPGLPWRSAHTS